MSGLALALISNRAVWLISVASALGTLIFASLWIYSTWALVNEVFSISELVFSNFILIYLFPRGLTLFVATILSGWFGAVGMLLYLGHYQV